MPETLPPQPDPNPDRLPQVSTPLDGLNEQLPFDPTNLHLDRFNSAPNSQSLEATLEDPNTRNRPVRGHEMVVRDGKVYFVKDGEADMADENENYRRLAASRIGDRLIYTMYSGTAGYGSKDHLRIRHRPLPGEFVLASTSGLTQPGSAGDQIVKSWGGPDCRLLYTEQTQNGARVVDPRTGEVVFPDVNNQPSGLEINVVVGMGSAGVQPEK